MCRKLNDTGQIAYGAVREGSLSLRVMLSDGSSCIFQGKRSDGRIGGNYICLQGGAIVDRVSGRWSGSTSVSESARARAISRTSPDTSQRRGLRSGERSIRTLRRPSMESCPA